MFGLGLFLSVLKLVFWGVLNNQIKNWNPMRPVRRFFLFCKKKTIQLRWFYETEELFLQSQFYAFECIESCRNYLHFAP